MFLGSLSLGIGVIGILLPGLPTTPFVLLAAALFMRGSDKVYSWIVNHRYFGHLIRTYRKDRSIPAKTKIVSIVLMWTMISVSVLFFVDALPPRIVIPLLGIVGTIVVLSHPTSRSR